jgi:hypothetical protein
MYILLSFHYRHADTIMHHLYILHQYIPYSTHHASFIQPGEGVMKDIFSYIILEVQAEQPFFMHFTLICDLSSILYIIYEASRHTSFTI